MQEHGGNGETSSNQVKQRQITASQVKNAENRPHDCAAMGHQGSGLIQSIHQAKG